MTSVEQPVYPVLSFAELDVLRRMSGGTVRLPFLPPDDRPEVFAAGLAALASRGLVLGTIDQPLLSPLAAAIGTIIGDVTNWIEVQVSQSAARYFVGAAGDGHNGILLSLLGFGSFQVAPLRSDQPVAISTTAIVTAVVSANETSAVQVSCGAASLTVSAGETIQGAQDRRRLMDLITTWTGTPAPERSSPEV